MGFLVEFLMGLKPCNHIGFHRYCNRFRPESSGKPSGAQLNCPIIYRKKNIYFSLIELKKISYRSIDCGPIPAGLKNVGIKTADEFNGNR